MERFHHPDRRSECIELLSSTPDAHGDGFVTRMSISAGYSSYGPPWHMVGLHLGHPVPVFHRWDRDETIYHFRIGDSFFAPVGMPIESAHSAATDTFYVFLSPLFLVQVAEDIGLQFHSLELRPVLGGYDSVIERIGHALHHEARDPGLGAAIYTEALHTQLAVHLIRSYGAGVPAINVTHGPTRQAQPDLHRAVEYMHAHMTTNLTVRELAALVHLSPFHFMRIFKQRYGLSPHQYLIRMRVEYAQQLLLDPRLTVNEIALLVGFTSHSHLIRHFKRLIGTTPRAT